MGLHAGTLFYACVELSMHARMSTLFVILVLRHPAVMQSSNRNPGELLRAPGTQHLEITKILCCFCRKPAGPFKR